ncbi:jg12183 [Pararge aegeria aegeria]|uniref:Jg12183 protein n=1 Tax=Pararge aegeria aegeria TaxID=348720 RepID=A0A8S4RAZ2_9NEOP|nr:jg12183 [Pararge aegeria aegeria]
MSVFGASGCSSVAFRRPSFGAKRVSDCLRRARSGAAPASAVNELTLTNAPLGIVGGKTGGLARRPRLRALPPTNRDTSRHSLRWFWREPLCPRCPPRPAHAASCPCHRATVSA